MQTTDYIHVFLRVFTCVDTTVQLFYTYCVWSFLIDM